MPKGVNLKIVRDKCLDCCAGDKKAALWCPCDGVHSPACPNWPFRLGMTPAKVAKRYCPALITPEAMPGANVSLDNLPGTPTAAAAYLRERTAAA